MMKKQLNKHTRKQTACLHLLSLQGLVLLEHMYISQVILVNLSLRYEGNF